MLTVYGDKRSGNCLKVLYTAQQLALPFTWVDIDIMQGGTRTADFLARNPAGQIPIIELADGQVLSESNAILLYLAEGSTLLPADAWARAQVYQWLFWEQYSHEPYIAVCRFQKVYLGKSDAELDPQKVQRGNAALALMAAHLQTRDWFVGDGLTVADIALVAYTRLAHEGGFDLSLWPPLQAWIARVERALAITA